MNHHRTFNLKQVTMKERVWRQGVSRASVLGLSLGAMILWNGCQSGAAVWRDTFDVDKADLGPTGGNEFFSLEPGLVLSFESGDETLTITVLNETRVVDGVTTRVIEERETAGGELVEVSRNFFASDSTTNDVYYFGEEVDIYENGVIVNHEGAWLSGQNGARFGLIMPGHAVVGDRYYQEFAPDVALDRAEHVAVDETVMTPAGTFNNCLHVLETTPLEDGESHKWYAPGVGLIQDADAVLVSVVQP